MAYGFAWWGDVELHVARVADLDPARSMSACYLWVEDADAIHARWTADGVPCRLHPAVAPDGNLLRIGSALKRA